MSPNFGDRRLVSNVKIILRNSRDMQSKMLEEDDKNLYKGEDKSISCDKLGTIDLNEQIGTKQNIIKRLYDAQDQLQNIKFDVDTGIRSWHSVVSSCDLTRIPVLQNYCSDFRRFSTGAIERFKIKTSGLSHMRDLDMTELTSLSLDRSAKACRNLMFSVMFINADEAPTVCQNMDQMMRIYDLAPLFVRGHIRLTTITDCKAANIDLQISHQPENAMVYVDMLQVGSVQRMMTESMEVDTITLFLKAFYPESLNAARIICSVSNVLEVAPNQPEAQQAIGSHIGLNLIYNGIKIVLIGNGAYTIPELEVPTEHGVEIAMRHISKILGQEDAYTK